MSDSSSTTLPAPARKALPTGSVLAWAALGLAATAAAFAGLAITPSPAHADDLYRYADADIPLGEKLIAEHRCAECHTRRVGGDGTAIYRPKGRINNPGALRGMVDYCSVELKLSLFAEEVTAIAAVLQRDHYRFPPVPPTAPATSPAAPPR